MSDPISKASKNGNVFIHVYKLFYVLDKKAFFKHFKIIFFLTFITSMTVGVSHEILPGGLVSGDMTENTIWNQWPTKVMYDILNYYTGIRTEGLSGPFCFIYSRTRYLFILCAPRH